MRTPKSLGEALLWGAILIGGIIVHQLWTYPPVSRRDGPPTEDYTVSVPSMWRQSYIKAVDSFTLSPEPENGMERPAIYLKPVDTEVSEELGDEKYEKALLKKYKPKLFADKFEWGKPITIGGLSHRRIDFYTKSKPRMVGPGMEPESKGFMVLVSSPKRVDIRFNCPLSTYEKYEPVAIEVVKSIEF